MNCRLCPRECGADRSESAGVCGVPQTVMIGRACRHIWEEPPISGTRGSGTVFFSGCPLKCVYCQNFALSRGQGVKISVRELADIFKLLEDAGAHNINLVTATHYALAVAEAAEIYRPKIPVVFNCGGYEKVRTLELLKDVVDIWLPDYKYALTLPAEKYSRAPDYPQKALEALLYMRELAPEDVFDKDGIMQKGMIVRHLVLPGNTENTIAVEENVAKYLGKDTYFSLMGQYYPAGEAARFPELARRLKPLEYKLAVARAEKLGLVNTFIQYSEEEESKYTPVFDGTVTGGIYGAKC